MSFASDVLEYKGKIEPASEDYERQRRREALLRSLPDNAFARDVGVFLNQALMDVNQLGANIFQDPETAKRSAQIAQDAEIAAAQLDKNSIAPEWLNRGFRSAGRSLTTMAPAGVVAGPYGAIAMGASVRGSQAIQEADEAGLKGADKFLYVARAGAIEGGIAGAFQAAGFGGLEKILGGAGKQVIEKGLKAALKRFGRNALEELTEEEITEIADNFNQALSGVEPDALSKENTIRTILDTAVATVLSVGMAQTGAEVAGRIPERQAEVPGEPAPRTVELNPNESVPEGNPLTPVVQGQPNVQDILTPQQARNWIKQKPEAAQELLNQEEPPSQKWFDQNVGPVARWNERNRRAFMAAVKEVSTTPGQGSEPLSPLPAASEPAPAQLGEFQINKIPNKIIGIRYDENIDNLSIDKPQGLYMSQAESTESKTPHSEYGNKRYVANITPSNPLFVDELNVKHARFYPSESGQASVGIVALKQLVGESRFNELLSLKKSEIKKTLESEFPGYDYNRYTDAYELLEAYAGQLARKKGYDAIVSRQPGEFSEVVILSKNALSGKISEQQSASQQAIEATETQPSEPAAPETGLTEQLAFPRPGKTPQTTSKQNEVPTWVVRQARALPENDVTNQDIINQFARDFGIRLSANGGLDKTTLGQYHRLIKSINLQKGHETDIAVASHEVAHQIDELARITKPGRATPQNLLDEVKKLDYASGQGLARAHEGFAEFVRYLLTTDEAKQKSPQFYDWFTGTFLEQNPQIGEKLLRIKRMVNQKRAQGAEARTTFSNTDKITLKGKDRVQQVLNSIARNFSDDLMALEKFDKSIERSKGIKLPFSQSAHKTATVHRGTAGAWAKDAIDNGVRSIKTGQRLSKGLLEIYENIPQEDFDKVMSLAYARHGLDWISKGMNPGATKADLQFILNKYKNRTDLLEAANDIVRWNKALVKAYTEVGGLSEAAAKRIIDSFPYYIPLKRVVDKRYTGPFKRAKGSGKEVVNPLLEMMRAASWVYNAGFRVQVGNILADLASVNSEQYIEGLGPLITPLGEKEQNEATQEAIKQLDKVGQGPVEGRGDRELNSTIALTQGFTFDPGNRSKTVVIFRDGKPTAYQFHPDLFDAVARFSFDVGDLHVFLRFLSKFTQLKRAGATSLRPGFGLQRNPARDVFTGIFQTKEPGSVVGPLKFLRKTFENLFVVPYERFTGKPNSIHALYLSMGGDMKTFIGQDIDKAYQHTQELSEQLYGKDWTNIRSVLRGILPGIQEILNVTESIPRLAEMELTLQRKGITKKDLAEILEAGEPLPMMEINESLLDASEVTVNFRRRGRISGFMNRVSAFLNANLQGKIQPYRALMRNPKQQMLRGLFWFTIPNMLYWWWVKDEDWYRRLPAWRKATFMNFKAPADNPMGWKVISIPRAFDIAMVFQGFPEAAMDSVYRQNPKIMKDFMGEVMPLTAEELGSTMADMTIPDAALPGLEVMVNYDMWRRKQIVDQGLLESQAPKDQFYQYNTVASQYLGRWLDMSPAKIDHLIAGYSGGLGTDILRAPEEGVLPAMGFKPTRIDRGVTVDEFYKRKEEVTHTRNSQKKDAEIPQAEADYKRFNAYSDLMADMRKIYQKELTVKARKEKMGEINRWITGLADFALGKEELKTYPNPLTAKNPPAEIAKIRDAYIGNRAFEFSQSKPEKQKGETPANYQARIDQWNFETDFSLQEMKAMGLTKDQAKEALRSHWERVYGVRKPARYSGKYKNRLTAYGERLNRIEQAFQ